MAAGWRLDRLRHTRILKQQTQQHQKECQRGDTVLFGERRSKDSMRSLRFHCETGRARLAGDSIDDGSAAADRRAIHLLIQAEGCRNGNK